MRRHFRLTLLVALAALTVTLVTLVSQHVSHSSHGLGLTLVKEKNWICINRFNADKSLQFLLIFVRLIVFHFFHSTFNEMHSFVFFEIHFIQSISVPSHRFHDLSVIWILLEAVPWLDQRNVGLESLPVEIIFGTFVNNFPNCRRVWRLPNYFIVRSVTTLFSRPACIALFTFLISLGALSLVRTNQSCLHVVKQTTNNVHTRCGALFITVHALSL